MQLNFIKNTIRCAIHLTILIKSIFANTHLYLVKNHQFYIHCLTASQFAEFALESD